MVDVFEHSARLDTAAVEERRDLVQIIPDGGKLPCDGFNFVRVDIEHIRGIHAAFHQHLRCKVIPASSACRCKSSCTTSVTRAEITFVFTIDFTFFFVLGMGSPFQNQEFDFPGSASALRL